MALRLAGERTLVIQGTDNQGWVREVTIQDSLPGLKVNQKGAGRILDFQDGGVSKMYLPDGGNVSLVGSLVFDLANDVTITPANPGAPRILTISDPGSNDTFVFLAATQTLTSKTLTAPVISQVVFPATQDPSADANTLDDYEEGSWTPTLIGSTTPGTQTYSAQVGRYVKIGRLVIAACRVALTAKDGAMAGSVYLGGLPFATENVSNMFWSAAIGQIDNIDIAASYNRLMMTVGPNNTSISVDQSGDNVAQASLTVAALAATAALHMTMSYRTA